MIDVMQSAYISEILRGIPHRYPFLLIDRVEACEPGKWVRVTKNVSQGDWYFRGIPFERQVMPQVLLLEALAQAAGALCHFSSLMSDPARTNRSVRRKLMALEERAARLAETTAIFHEAARAFGKAMESPNASDYTRQVQTAHLARCAVKFTKAIERARDER